MNQSNWISTLGLLLISAGCGTNVPSQELERMLDERAYNEVIELLEKEVEADPKSPSVPLLAKAHLGAAGLESLDLISRVLGAQPENQELERLVPNCPRILVSSAENLELRCIVLRIFQNLPPSDNFHLNRARAILERGLPEDAKSSPEKTNLIFVYAELASALARARDVLLRYEIIDPVSATQAEIEWFFSEISGLADSAQKVLQRAKYLPRNVSHLLTGKSRQSVISYRGPSLEFIQQTALPQIIKLSNGRPSDPTVALFRVTLVQGLDDAVRALKKK